MIDRKSYVFVSFHSRAALRKERIPPGTSHASVLESVFHAIVGRIMDRIRAAARAKDGLCSWSLCHIIVMLNRRTSA